MQNVKRLLLILMVCVALIMLTPACNIVGSQGLATVDETVPAETTPESDAACVRTGMAAGPGQVWMTLYFPDRQGWYAVPEFRRVEIAEGQSVEDKLSTEEVAVAAVEQLMKGPEEETLLSIFPDETELLGVTLTEKGAIVDFSHHLKTNFPGGSTWEMLVLRSLVNTLTEIEGIDQVQLTLEGEQEESLGGHMAIDGPLERDPVESGPITLDYDRVELLQKRVDNKHEVWRTDPAQVVCRESRAFGFDGLEPFELLLMDSGEEQHRSPRALFRARSGDTSYIISLVQPIRVGEEGLWTITEIREESP